MHDLRSITEEDRERLRRKRVALGKAILNMRVSTEATRDRMSHGFLREAVETGFIRVDLIEHIRETLDRHGIE